MSLSASDFVYTALPEDSIRLLQFSSNAAGKLVCSMSNVLLAQAPNFYALSYAWGSDTTTETVLCNGLSIKIRANLYEAIQTLVNPPVALGLPIWIDAICINQLDDGEKNIQVGRMGEIFRRAHQVVAWLGPSLQDSDMAMDSLERLSVTLPTIPHEPLYSELEEHGLPGSTNQLWLALGYLFRREWFGRLWTFQEAVLAPDISTVCGQKTVGWKVIATVGQELWRLSLVQTCVGYQELKPHENGFIAIADVTVAKRELASYGDLNFIYLLAIADSKICSDARDRVYAMLGMAGADFRDRIQVSYSNDSDQAFIQTYIDCAKACLEESLPVILERVGGRQYVPGLPSWCPNLNSPQQTVGFSDHMAGILDHTTESFRGKIILECNNLAISGFRVDTVSEDVEETFPISSEDVAFFQKFPELEARCLSLAQKTFSISSEIIPMDYILTLSGRRRQPNIPDDDLHQAYLDNILNCRSAFQGSGSFFPPMERRPLFHDIWEQMFHSCSGRRYFSTKGGRLGLGPPDMKEGDTICVFYGTRPVFILREVKEKAGEWLLIGDAFVHGLMDLSETPQSARGPDEIFTLV